MSATLSRIDLWGYLGVVLSTIVLVGLLIFALLKLRAWYAESNAEPCDWQSSLTEYRQLEQEGLITREEFQRIKRQIISKTPSLKDDLKDPVSPSPPDVGETTPDASANSDDESHGADLEKSNDPN